MTCLTPETAKILKDRTGMSEKALTLIMEHWTGEKLPTRAECLDIYNEKVVNAKDSALNEMNERSSAYEKKIRERIATIRKTLDTTKLDPNIKVSLEENVKNLRQQVKELSQARAEDNNDAVMLKVANYHLDYVQALLDKPSLSVYQCNEIAAYLDMYNNFSNVYVPKSYRKVLNSEGQEEVSEIYKRSLEVVSRVKDLNSVFTEREQDVALERNAEFGQDVLVTKEELLAPRKDIGWFDSMLRPLGLVGDSVLAIMSNIANLVNNKAAALQSKYNKRVMKAFGDLKESDLFKRLGYEPMYVRDEKGNVIGTTSRYKTSYYTEMSNLKKLKELAHEEGDEEAMKKADKAYYKWMDENHHFVNLYGAFSEETGELIDQERIGEARAKMTEMFGESLANEYIEDALGKIEKYFGERESARGLYGVTPEGIAKFKMWELEHSPYTSKKARASLTVDGKYVADNSYKFKTYKPIAEHADPNYKLIMEDSAYREAFLAYSQVVGDYMGAMPKSFLENNAINKNFIPWINKGVWDTFKTEGWGEGLKEFQKEAYDWFRASEKSQVIRDEVLEDGETTMSIPIHFMSQPKVAKDGELVPDFDKQELDLEKVLLTIIPQVSKFQFKVQLQPFMTQALRIVNEMKEDVGVDSDGVPIPTKGLERIKALAKYHTEVFAGKANEHPGTTSKVLMTEEEKEVYKLEIENLDKAHQAYTAEITKNVQDEAERDRLIEEHAKLTELRKNAKLKKFSFGKTVRSMLRYYTLKTLGFNPGTALNELIQGSVSVLIHAAGNEDFSMGDFLGAVKNSRSKKTVALRNLYNINPAKINGEMKESKFEKVANWMTEQSDSVTKGAILEAKMKNTMLEGLEGPISLYDAYDEEGNWRSELFSPEVNADWSPDTDISLSTNAFYRYQNQVRELNMRLLGAYDEQAALMAKKSTLGKAAMMFKTWIGEAYSARFEKRSKSNLGRDVKGRWRSLYDVYDRHGLKDTMFALLTGRTQGLELVDGDLDAANIRKDMVEFRILLGCLAASWLIALMVQDDDDEEGVTTKAAFYALNTIGRMQQDLTYFANPGEAKKLLDNMVPVLRLYKDGSDLFTSFGKTVVGDDEITQGIYRGWNRTGKEFAEILPVTNAALKMYGTFKEDKSKID